ncbi:glucose dehydrogenase [FAD, quinone]-like [Diabrotica virgifera virgifera]|uniref:Glucose dehydrogenase [FAD, quinone]-like n=1 Tax=Diabrotica virgifera virgifera TaxID=50390 RepID=A0A6P7FX09_DIAVI|nr:glucose dehydrogenase [FAD, quinone]-like [Diabrotica virgifera virgifera]
MLKAITMTINVYLLVCLSVMKTITCSPPSVDPYIESFAKGLNEIEHIAKEYKLEEQNFDAEKLNSSAGPRDFDFIIIGSGASGAALATRLSEVHDWKILVLEAGFVETPISQVPNMYQYLQTTPYEWGYTTTEQKHSCLGMEGHKCSIKYGKALGGITSVDNMLYTRGNQRDYDKWADLGLKNWCWNDVAHYFKKMEDAYIPELDRKHHAFGGPIHLEHFRHSTGLGKHILEAGHELGIKAVDYNGKDQLGLSLPHATTKAGRRNSVAQSYLGQAIKRPNLEVRLGARVIQILISPHTKEAYGVKFVQDGHILVGKATKEIILAAGPVNTPQLLLLSGIGPKEDLETLKIENLADLKVGSNLKDQLSFLALNFHVNESSKVPEQKEMVEQLLKLGGGPLTSPGIEAVGYLKTEASKESVDYPDIEMVVHKDVLKNAEQFQRANRIKKDMHEVTHPETDYFNIEVNLLHPKSTGSLKLHDHDPFHYPLINPNSLTDHDDHDLETLVAGIHKAIKLSKTEALQKLGLHLSEKKVPGCETEQHDHYWKCAVRHLSTNKGHITGTARMGAEGDKEAVVDEKLRVKGIHKLRVADASVIPVTISGNLVGPSIMIGERAADLLKEDWK